MQFNIKVKSKIKTLEEAIPIINGWKLEGLKIVFTNGCFDLAHAGHVDYLSKARDLGDKLVIGLNTDNSVSRIKGESRPVQDQFSRSSILGAFEFVDMIIFFDDETPINLISEIKPNILVKGADYKPEQIVGYKVVTENGGSVETIEFLEGYSSTNIINKILKYS